MDKVIWRNLPMKKWCENLNDLKLTKQRIICVINLSLLILILLFTDFSAGQNSILMTDFNTAYIYISITTAMQIKVVKTIF